MKKILLKNKKAFFNYQIIDNYEAGIVLAGPEVKSLKAGQGNLSDSYATVDQREEVYLTNFYISPYKYARIEAYNPKRARKLLLTKKEINSLIGKLKTKGLALVPLEIFQKGNLIKVKLALACGKKLYDKREKIKKREQERKIQKSLKQKFKP